MPGEISRSFEGRKDKVKEIPEWAKGGKAERKEVERERVEPIMVSEDGEVYVRESLVLEHMENAYSAGWNDAEQGKEILNERDNQKEE